jgi:hypothetical protein
MWRDEGALIALSVSTLFMVVAWVMRHVFVRILKNGADEPGQKDNHE